MNARRVARDDVTYEARVAWSSSGGQSLCYFIALDGEVPAESDRADRRAALEPGEDFAAASDARLSELLDAGRTLTDTERRFETPDGESWLAQSIGPVWAEGVASGLTGVLFTSLSGSAERASVAAGHIGGLGAADLISLWIEARGEPAV